MLQRQACALSTLGGNLRGSNPQNTTRTFDPLVAGVGDRIARYHIWLLAARSLPDHHPTSPGTLPQELVDAAPGGNLCREEMNTLTKTRTENQNASNDGHESVSVRLARPLGCLA
jgi:hypothetical protein